MKILTGVFSHTANLYFSKNLTKVSLISIKANRMPTQLRGPAPNGIKAQLSRLFLPSALNLFRSK